MRANPAPEPHVFHLAMPYFDHAKQPRGVVYVSYDLKWLANRLNGLQWNAGQSFSVIDRDGIILVRQPDWERYVGRPTPSDTWKRVTTAEATFDLEARSPWDGIQRVIGVIPTALGPGHLAVTVGLSHQVAFSSLNDASLREILVVTFGALLAFSLAWMIGLRLVRTPIEGLLERLGDGEMAISQPAPDYLVPPNSDSLGRRSMHWLGILNKPCSSRTCCCANLTIVS